MKDQEYIFNENSAIYNCNICGDVQIVETAEGQQPPESCCNPDCESNINRDPFPGLKVEYVDYQSVNKIWQFVPENCCAILVDDNGRGKPFYNVAGINMILGMIKVDLSFVDYLIRTHKDGPWPYVINNPKGFILRPGIKFYE